MSAKTFDGYKIVASNVVNSALYLSHSLGGSARNDQMINKVIRSSFFVRLFVSTDKV